MITALLLSLAVSLPADTGRVSLVSSESSGSGEGHQMVAALAAGLDPGTLSLAEEAVRAEVRRGGFPGAALAVGRRGQVVLERGFGSVGWGSRDAAVSADETIYDLASLTKVVATTTAVMLLVEDGTMELQAPVSRYLPEFRGPHKNRDVLRVTVRDLLTHTSGLPAGGNIWGYTPEQALSRALAIPLKRLPGERVEYSDIGFVILAAAAERAAGEPLPRLLDRRIFGPLGMRSTTYLPGEGNPRCAPTFRRGDGSAGRGRVHDPIANRLGGIAGNAGLFSTAHDLARFAAMMANGGELDGVRVLEAETIRRFTERQRGSDTRALGWDTPDRDGGGAAGLRISPRAFGHTGFTGTSLWIDPDRGTWAVLLSNRVYETRAPNRIQSVRRSVNDWVAGAVREPVLNLGVSGGM